MPGPGPLRPRDPPLTGCVYGLVITIMVNNTAPKLEVGGGGETIFQLMTDYYPEEFGKFRSFLKVPKLDSFRVKKVVLDVCYDRKFSAVIGYIYIFFQYLST